jgi:hypothetical protein
LPFSRGFRRFYVEKGMFYALNAGIGCCLWYFVWNYTASGMKKNER